MKALVLAAGKGTRLGAAADGLPKPLVDLGGTTPLEHSLTQIAALEPERIWINVHEAAPVLRQRIGAEWHGTPVCYSYEDTLLGTAGAWKNLAGEWTQTTLIVYGDNHMKLDYQALLSAHRSAQQRCGALVTIALFDPARHANTGIAGGRVRLEDGLVREFVEGAGTGLVNAGAYAVEPALLERLESGFLDFGRDVFPALAGDGMLAGHVLEEGAYCLGVDTPAAVATAREMLRATEPVA
jgi:NDP-sugar pyrophosphorylase family protein